jgi:NAD-dependent dihydropyrimidine dehydrogenase PreA subunit
MKQWEIEAAIEGMEAHHFTQFSGGVHRSHCHGCGQEWPCRTERLKQEVIAEFRRLKKLESDHV